MSRCRRLWRAALAVLLLSVLLLGPDATSFATVSDETPDVVSTTLTTNRARYGVLQTDIVELSVSGGPLRVVLQGEAPDGLVYLIVWDGADLLAYRPLIVGDEEAALDIALPSGPGAYGLQLVHDHALAVHLQAPGLAVSESVPALRIPGVTPFEVRHEDFTFQPETLNPDEVAVLSLFFNGYLVEENLLLPDGSVQPVAVPAGSLSDEVYTLFVIGGAMDSLNEAYVTYSFLVDREDAFPDVPPSHWARPYIEAMHHWGIMAGRPDGTYAPGLHVSRGEFAKLLAVTLDLTPTPGTANPFVDMEGHWARDYAVALWDYGLTQGVVIDGQRYFQPERQISRAEAATFVARTLGLHEVEVVGELFPDWADVPDWARASVSALARIGWLDGYPDGSFHPWDMLNRDQAAKLLAKFWGM